MARTIEELDNFNNKIANSGLNPRIQEFLVAINNCTVDPFEGLAYAISQYDFDKRLGFHENLLQVTRPLADGEAEILNIKLREDGKLAVEVKETENGRMFNALATTIVIDKDGKGTILPHDANKDVRVTTFRLEKERIVDVKEDLNIRPFKLGKLVEDVLCVLEKSENENLYVFVQNLMNYKPENAQDLSTDDNQIIKLTRDLSNGWKEETNIVRNHDGISFQVSEYNKEKLYSTEIEVSLDPRDDWTVDRMCGKVTISQHTYEGTQKYSKDLEETFELFKGQVLTHEDTKDLENGEGK